MRYFKLALSSFVLLFASAPALADFNCVGTLSTSWVNAAGEVFMTPSWRNDNIMICNMKSSWKGITPDVCTAWLAKIDAAVTLGKQVNIYYVGSGTCATVPAYNAAPSPEYIMLLSS